MNKRIKKGDRAKARSLIKASQHQMNYTLTIPVSDNSASTIIRNIYECFRMLGEALLVNKGTIYSDHVESINELTKLDVKSGKPLQLIETLRKIRHKINYDEYMADAEEAREAISIAKSLFYKVHKKVESLVEGSDKI